MTRKEVQEAMNEVFHDIFDDDSIVVNDKMTADDVEGWDSLEHINLMVALENRFGVKFGMAEITKMRNVGEMTDKIMEKLN